MSVESITKLEEEAQELAEGYFNSTPMAEILLEAIKRKDYDNLRHNVKWANDIIFDNEYNPGEVKDQRDEVGDIY